MNDYTYLRRAHQRELMGQLTEEARLMGQVQALVPADVWQNMERHLEGMAHPSERITYLTRTMNQVTTWREVVEDAEHIHLVDDNKVKIIAGDVQFVAAVHWRTMRHLALSEGWTAIGPARLEKRRAGRRHSCKAAIETEAGTATNSPAPEAPNSEDPTTANDTTNDSGAQAPAYHYTFSAWERRAFGLGAPKDASGHTHQRRSLLDTAGIGPRKADGTPLRPPALVGGAL